MLAAMNITNWQCIYHYYMNENQTLDSYFCPYMHFASNFIVELFEDNGVWSVRHTFNDKYYDICDGNFTDEANFKCSYESYYRKLKDSIGDFNSFCFPKKDKKLLSFSTTEDVLFWSFGIASAGMIIFIFSAIYMIINAD